MDVDGQALRRLGQQLAPAHRVPGGLHRDVCPGKYLILIAGDTGDVRAAMKEGESRGGECVVDTLLLPK